jgi:geranylgeranyl pyrophosphate synthase
MMVTNPFSERAAGYKGRVDTLMSDFVSARSAGGRLGDAVQYAVQSEGKRIRALLCYATAELLEVPDTTADYPAAAIELIHTYSLVHDDLPAMDNDDLRRGQPTVHKQFDEATGILVGDALLTYAFELLASADVKSELIVGWVRCLSSAAGGLGMIVGQSTDLEGETRNLSLPELEKMHRQKSGALIEASLSSIVSASGNVESGLALGKFGHHIGLAFQIRDDILDVEVSTEQLGKPQGSDANNSKSTFVSLLGLEKAKKLMQDEFVAANAQLDHFGESAQALRWIANYIVARQF